MIPPNPTIRAVNADSPDVYIHTWRFGDDPEIPGQPIRLSFYADETTACFLVFGHEIPWPRADC